MIVPFVMAGAGMALVFAPSANAVLASVRTDQAGQASGANNAIREVGGVLGVAVLASVFTGAGGYASPQAFVDGLLPAMWVGVAVLAAGALVVLALPFGAQASAGAAQPAGAAGVREGAPVVARGGRVSADPAAHARRRVPAAERREELIAAAVHEFAHGGLHGTTVERIARRVGVAQPYVFSLFPNKRELFLAALERSFERVADTFRRAAADYREGRAPADCEDALEAMGRAYRELLSARPRLPDAPAPVLRRLRRRGRARSRQAPLRRAGRARPLALRRGARAPGRLLPPRHGPQRRRRARRARSCRSDCAWVQAELR